jgi:hypothetical protein
MVMQDIAIHVNRTPKFVPTVGTKSDRTCGEKAVNAPFVFSIEQYCTNGCGNMIKGRSLSLPKDSWKNFKWQQGRRYVC